MHIYDHKLEHLQDDSKPMRFAPNREWIVLGSGIGAGNAYRELRSSMTDRGVVPIVATCNNGIKDEPAPTVYWLTDPIAAHIHSVEHEHAQAALRRGARLVTSIATLKDQPHMAHLATDLVIYSTHWHTAWRVGELRNGRTSGCFLVQLATICQASAVHMVGMSGYRSSRKLLVRDYDDGRDGIPIHEDTMRYYGPLMQSVFDLSPATEFIFHGQPAYGWRGPNVTVQQPAAAHAAHAKASTP